MPAACANGLLADSLPPHALQEVTRRLSPVRVRSCPKGPPHGPSLPAAWRPSMATPPPSALPYLDLFTTPPSTSTSTSTSTSDCSDSSRQIGPASPHTAASEPCMCVSQQGHGHVRHLRLTSATSCQPGARSWGRGLRGGSCIHVHGIFK